jgi:hypothetical protein
MSIHMVEVNAVPLHVDGGRPVDAAFMSLQEGIG